VSFDGVGMSQYTGGKEECFDKIITMHINIVSSIAKKSYADYRYHYVDLNAGPGEYDCDGSLIEGSPIKFLKAVCNKMPFKASLIEKDADILYELRNSICEYTDQYSDSIDIYQGDNENIFSSLYKDFSGKKLFGLIYSDPNNGIPPLNIFSQVCSNPIYATMDLLTYIQAGFIKRARNNPVFSNFLSLTDYINRIDKKYWLIRSPTGSRQFSFLLGTNWDGFPEYKKYSLHDIRTEQGKDILERLNKTKTELESDYAEAQPKLF
jgi:hypothetical protein